MFGLGMGEIVVILVVALIVLGPAQLPDAAKQVGKAIRSLRKHTRDLQDTIEKDEAIGGTMRELKSALRGDDIFREPPIAPTEPAAEVERPVAQGEEATPSAAPPLAPPPPAAPASTPAADTTHDG